MSVIALVLIGLNLRAGITGASALLHDLQLVLGYGPLIASVIPSIPTLCFAVAGAATSWLTGRLGVEKAILLSLAMLTAGLLLRGIPSTGMLLAGTVVGMSGLAVCNVAMPSFIREHFAHRTSLMTGLYTVTMTTGATSPQWPWCRWPSCSVRRPPEWAPSGFSLCRLSSVSCRWRCTRTATAWRETSAMSRRGRCSGPARAPC
jgi:hypothetical protein